MMNFQQPPSKSLFLSTCDLGRTGWLCLILALWCSRASSLNGEEAITPDALQATLAEILAEHGWGDGIQTGFWLGSTAGECWFEQNADAVLPTASAIKAFYLMELYDKYRGHLDEPLPGVKEIVVDRSHPAVSHFTPQQQADIRAHLPGASVRRIGEIMTGQSDLSNAVYNAAANVVTVVLGGPEQLTQAIHARDPDFREVVCRRYMLRDRTMPGDNEATTRSFARLYEKLSTGTLNRIDEETHAAIRQTLHWPKRKPGRQYAKSGSLSSSPLIGVRAGWWETETGDFVFVVMASQPVTGEQNQQSTRDQLRETVNRLEAALVAAGRARTAAAAGL